MAMGSFPNAVSKIFPPSDGMGLTIPRSRHISCSGSETPALPHEIQESIFSLLPDRAVSTPPSHSVMGLKTAPHEKGRYFGLLFRGENLPAF